METIQDLQKEKEKVNQQIDDLHKEFKAKKITEEQYYKTYDRLYAWKKEVVNKLISLKLGEAK